VLIAGHRKLLPQRLDRQAVRGFQKKRMRRQVRRRAQAHERRGGGHDRDVEVAALDAIERRQALGHQVLVRRKLVVGERFPVRQQAHAQLRREPRDLLEQTLRVERGGGDDGERCGPRHFLLREAAERERVRRAGEPGIASGCGKRPESRCIEGVTCAIISP